MFGRSDSENVNIIVYVTLLSKIVSNSPLLDNLHQTAIIPGITGMALLRYDHN